MYPKHQNSPLLFFLTIFLLCTHKSVKTSFLHSNESKAALNELFDQLDSDGDGQIGVQEAVNFLGVSALGSSQEFDTTVERTEAYQRMIASLDGADVGETISEQELEGHLGGLFRSYSVVDWVKHGLGHAQHAGAFQQNAISPLDFPLLVKNNGAMLQNELGIVSELHRTQILRAIQRQILGLGEVPSPPIGLSCICHMGKHMGDNDSQQTAVLPQDLQQMVLVWKEPKQLGHPHVHKYTAEVQCSSGPPVWQEIEQSEEKKLYVRVNVNSQDSCRFRVFAWNNYGRSNASEILQCQYDNECLNTKYESQEDQLIISKNQNEPYEPFQWLYAWMSSLLLLIPVLMRFVNVNIISNFAQLAYCRLRKTKIQETGQNSQQTQFQAQQQLLSQQHFQGPSIERTKSISIAQLQQPPRQNYGHHVRSNSLPSLIKLNVDDLNNNNHPQFSNRSISDGHLEINNNNLVNKYKQNQQIQQINQTISEEGQGQPRQRGNRLLLRRQSFVKERDSCSFGSCQVCWKRWYLRKDHLKALLKSHYCGICQNHYCKKHTRISPHGSSGRCGQDSACICIGCFNSLSPSVQHKLDAVNKLNIHKTSFKSTQRSSSNSIPEIEHQQEQFQCTVIGKENQFQNCSQYCQIDNNYNDSINQDNNNNINNNNDKHALRGGSGNRANKNWDTLSRKIWAICKWYGQTKKRKQKSQFIDDVQHVSD